MEEYRQRKSHNRTKRLRPQDFCSEMPLDLTNPKDSRTDCYRRSRIRKGHSHRPWRYSCSCWGRENKSPSARRRLLVKELMRALEPESMY